MPMESLHGMAVKRARAHELGGWGHLPRRQSMPKEGLRGHQLIGRGVVGTR